MSKSFFSLLSFFLAPTLLFGQGFINVAENHTLDFTYETEEYGGGVSFVDFNQDGLDDLSFASESGLQSRFFINTGSGFEELPNLIADTSAVKQILWVDYNNDHLLDVYLTSASKNRLFKNIGNLTFEDVTEAVGFDFPLLTSYCSTWFDYDNDGRLDLLVAHRTPEQNGWVDLYRNLDNISFEKQTIQAGLKTKGVSVLAMTTFDYNNDGWEDIFFAQDWEKGNQLFKNNGNGTFRDVSLISKVDYEMNSMTATVMDINEDGWQDLFVTNTTMGTVLLVNNGQGSFEEKGEYYNLDLTSVTFGTVFFDADNDGDDDVHVGGLVVNHTYEDQDNEEAFKRRTNDWGFQLDRFFNNGVAVGDFNNDGCIDIVKNSVSRGGVYVSKNSLWQNQFTGHNYIKIQLEGTISNFSAIGSKVQIYTTDKIQHKRVGCGESFSSQHSLIQHFGVNQEALIDSIVINWTSGNVSVLSNIPCNQTIVITEPPLGCTDVLACNFHPAALSDNGSCRYAQNYHDCHGCLDDIDEDGVCDQLEIYGCVEIDACNFSWDATEADGSCEYIPVQSISGPSEWEAMQIAQYYYPSTSNNRYEWSIQNGAILGGNQSNEVTVLWYEHEEGEISVVEIDESECVGPSVSKTIQITPTQTHNNTEIFITPNPVATRLTIHSLHSTTSHYSIHNSTGQLMLKGKLEDSQNHIGVSSLSTGFYFLKLNRDGSDFQEIFYKE